MTGLGLSHPQIADMKPAIAMISTFAVNLLESHKEGVCISLISFDAIKSSSGTDQKTLLVSGNSVNNWVARTVF